MNWFPIWLICASGWRTEFVGLSYGEFMGKIRVRRIEELNRDPRDPRPLGYGL